MEILNAQQIRDWDEYTMQYEPILSTDLMERAALTCFSWLGENGYEDRSFSIFCGKGNNGGDGLALARLLSQNNNQVTVYILEFGHKGTVEFQSNLAWLHPTSVDIRFVQTEENLLPIPSGDIIIDALVGSGLNRPLEGVTAKLIGHINQSGNTIISIDLPSGMYVDKSSKGNPIVRADYTLSFQCYKLAFLMPENGDFVGELEILDIGLHPGYLSKLKNDFSLVDIKLIREILKPRNKFSNKGNFGHALILAGSYGKMGAAILSAKACLRIGAGLVTCHLPKCGYEIMQIALPEAMTIVDDDENIITGIQSDLTKYSVLGIGPGIGKDERTKFLMESIFTEYKKPVVLDADALNIISENKIMLEQLPTHSILTPHPKEFERLFGVFENDFERINAAKENAKLHDCIIVLKGHFTFIAMPDGRGYFNSTGNAGMAKGGSGDVLTGMVTGLLSQGYSSSNAAILAVYLHGLAGDLSASYYSQQSIIASDIIGCIGQAILTLDKI